MILWVIWNEKQQEYIKNPTMGTYTMKLREACLFDTKGEAEKDIDDEVIKKMLPEGEEIVKKVEFNMRLVK